MKFLFLLLTILLSACSSTSKNIKNEVVSVDYNNKKDYKKEIFKWRQGIYIETDLLKVCNSFIQDESQNTFSIIFYEDKSNKNKGVKFQIKTKHKILNDGELVTDIKVDEKFKKRVRFVSYKNSSNIFLLDSTSVTKSSFEKILKKIRKGDELELMFFDKKWVQYEYTFTLKNSMKSIKEASLLCY